MVTSLPLARPEGNVRAFYVPIWRAMFGDKDFQRGHSVLLKDRAKLQSVPWNDLVQADAVITLGSMQERRLQPERFPGAQVWWPATHPSWGEHPFPLFLLFSSRVILSRWLPVFQVPDVDTFLRTFETLITVPGGQSYLGQAHPRYTYARHLLGTRS